MSRAVLGEGTKAGAASLEAPAGRPRRGRRDARRAATVAQGREREASREAVAWFVILLENRTYTWNKISIKLWLKSIILVAFLIATESARTQHLQSSN